MLLAVQQPTPMNILFLGLKGSARRTLEHWPGIRDGLELQKIGATKKKEIALEVLQHPSKSSIAYGCYRSSVSGVET